MDIGPIGPCYLINGKGHSKFIEENKEIFFTKKSLTGFEPRF